MTADLTRAIDRFADALEANTESSRRIRTQIHETERRRRRASVAAAAAGILLLLLTTVILLTLMSINETQNAIKDCTDRTRATAVCARSNDKNTARVIGQLVQGELTVNYVTEMCAKREDDEAAFRQCVQQELADVKSGKRKLPVLP